MGGNKQSLRKEERTLVLPGTEWRDEVRHTFGLKPEQSRTSRGVRNGTGCLSLGTKRSGHLLKPGAQGESPDTYLKQPMNLPVCLHGHMW